MKRFCKVDIIAEKEGQTLPNYINRGTEVHYKMGHDQLPAVISTFHQNVRNRKMREELAMTKVKDVAELYFWPIGAPGLTREGSNPARRRCGNRLYR